MTFHYCHTNQLPRDIVKRYPFVELGLQHLADDLGSFAVSL